MPLAGVKGSQVQILSVRQPTVRPEFKTSGLTAFFSIPLLKTESLPYMGFERENRRNEICFPRTSGVSLPALVTGPLYSTKRIYTSKASSFGGYGQGSFATLPMPFGAPLHWCCSIARTPAWPVFPKRCSRLLKPFGRLNRRFAEFGPAPVITMRCRSPPRIDTERLLFSP
ncbi:hypothetical protein CPPEL_06065 [Corynebacterium pseudopelargi]|uniref:Uncharacterized protein n=1 Tax=Corynebacterium pseudopelargi TaxID=2080757 RepID=A0A3G6IUA4_9CORY|nr:hypothetical protein CPPEL_06065 [Corynebacterium pseudopelargi]